jgi:hypothetical protein
MRMRRKRKMEEGSGGRGKIRICPYLSSKTRYTATEQAYA